MKRFVRLRYVLPLYGLILAVQSFGTFWINRDSLPAQGRYAGTAGTDAQAYYAFVRSIVIDGDLDFENEFYEHNYNRHGFQTPDFVPRSPYTGRYFNRYPAGFSFLHAPFFLLAHGVALAMPAWPADGYSPPYQIALPLQSIVYSMLALWLTVLFLTRYGEGKRALLTGFVVFLAFQGAFTAIWFWANPNMQTLLVFAAMLLAMVRIRERSSWVRWAGLGALVGLAGLLRTECLMLALAPFALWVLSAIEERRLTGRRLIEGGLCFCATMVVFFPQLLFWRLMWGEWFQVPMNNPGEGFNWTSPKLLAVLFSTRHGLFYWSPLLLPGLVGLLIRLKGKPRPVVLWIGALNLAVAWYIYACWKIWWMGYSFGARQFIPFTPLFAVGVLYWVERFRLRRYWLALAGMCFVGWNQVMLWLFLNGHIPRSDGFPPWLPFVRFFQLVGKVLS